MPWSGARANLADPDRWLDDHHHPGRFRLSSAVVDNGPLAGQAAFAIAIDAEPGVVTVEQYLSASIIR